MDLNRTIVFSYHGGVLQIQCLLKLNFSSVAWLLHLCRTLHSLNSSSVWSLVISYVIFPSLGAKGEYPLWHHLLPALQQKQHTRTYNKKDLMILATYSPCSSKLKSGTVKDFNPPTFAQKSGVGPIPLPRPRFRYHGWLSSWGLLGLPYL